MTSINSSILFLLFIFSINGKGFAQSVSQKKQFTIQKSATINVSEIKEDWNPSIQNIEAPSTGTSGDRKRLQEIKDSLQLIYPKKNISSSTRINRSSLPSPFLGKNFQGNSYNNSTPNDNDIAISGSNMIISVQNTSVFSYNLNTNTLLSFISLNAFGASLNNSNQKYDPKVIYDPNADKFILVYLNGYTDSTSSITVAFSQTNNPVGAWNLYSLPGNPLNNGLWTDYPMLAITDKEVFITGNLLYPDSSWQTGFNETVIWQINTAKGYSGQALSSHMHHAISSNGKRVRNLCPVRGGSAIYGPDMYFLSNRNLDPQNDSIFLIHITDTIGATNQVLTAMPYVSNRKYFVPPPASQPGPGVQLLETNDSRILGAFLENGKIQFVGNCMDTASGNAAVYHCVIKNVTSVPIVSATIIADTIEFGYPNISYIGSGPSDNTAAISFNHSSATVLPGISALIADDNGNYSPFLKIKNGVKFISVLQGNERWGDYTGSQRKYNDTGVVWLNGMFGNSNWKNTTWIGQLSLTSLTGIEQDYQNNKSISEMSLFPNPTSDITTISLVLEKPEYLTFEVFDATGKMVKLLLREKVKAGKNNFSFSTTPLNKGVYILKVSSATNNEFQVQKFIKE